MRIAIPAHGGRLNPHFGQTIAFEVATIDEHTRSITERRPVPVDTSGGCGALPALLQGAGVSVVLCGGLGGGAKANLERVGIRVISGAPEASIDDLLAAFVAGTLTTAGGTCSHEHGHDHHHGPYRATRHGRRCEGVSR